MSLSADARRQIVDRYATSAAAANPAMVEQVIDDVVAATRGEPERPVASPFAAPWLDSFLAHWTLGETVDLTPTAAGVSEKTADAIRDLVDIKFRERLAELERFLPDRDKLLPDGGPPEPGTPPVGPVSAFGLAEPPDGGPPEPGTPPVGPQTGFLADNPWILYWFISLRAPMLLDVIDAHLTRRLEELSAERR